MVKVFARRSHSQVQDKPHKEDHFYVIVKRQVCVLCMPKHPFFECQLQNIGIHWMECPPCWYNEVLLVIVNKDELIKHMCYNDRSAGLFKPWNTYTYPSPINEGNSHLLNYV